MGSKILICIIAVIVLSTVAHAATIEGNVYDIYLKKKNNSILTIDTIPKQNYISKDGYYKFSVPPGDYKISAEYYEYNQLKYSASEKISVKEEGDYIVDIILLPSFEEEDQLIEETSQIKLESTAKDKLLRILLFILYTVIGLIVIGVIAGSIYYIKRKESKEETIIPDVTDKVIEFIKSQDGRTTQKDIRRNFDLSEAKISLIISELESKEIIKKIKKGRGNIIILQK